MAFDALETEFANAKLVRSLSRRDERRYYWRLLPADSDACTRIAAQYTGNQSSMSGRRISLSRSVNRFLELLSEPCGVMQLENFCISQRHAISIHWLKFLRYVHPTVVDMPKVSYMHTAEIYNEFLRKSPPDLPESVAVDMSKSNKGNSLQQPASPAPSNSMRSRSATVPVLNTKKFIIPESVDNDIAVSIAHGAGLEAFLELAKLAVSWLASEVWTAFLNSEEFRRFTQLKEFAMRPVTPEDFSTFRVMGRGAYGAVSAVEKVNTHRIYAWKEMNKRQLKHQRAIDVALNEVKILSELDSPFITGLRYCLQTSESLVLVLDFCSGGDLSYHMKKSPPINNYTVPNDAMARSSASGRRRRKNPMPPELAQFYTAEIILGLEHMHMKRIVFRDLKPANILLDRNGGV